MLLFDSANDVVCRVCPTTPHDAGEAKEHAMAHEDSIKVHKHPTLVQRVRKLLHSKK
jgi:hypothetical protein